MKSEKEVAKTPKTEVKKTPLYITPGAHQTERYVAQLKGKKIALVVNQTSTINQTHLVDSLLSLGLDIVTIFAPEHGFRGKADAGEHVKNGKDAQTGVSIISLYGDNKKPKAEQLAKIDVVVFDIQDVGARFYTYISTLHYVMEACGENNKELIVLDRPNPNGDYVDGPVLDLKYKSFVGMHPIPVVYGLTIGELANMMKGENWISSIPQYQVISLKNYTHDSLYHLPTTPSPNLPNHTSIRLYPSLCLFEATTMSIGRGTYEPFQMIGYPDSSFGPYTFTPTSIDGMSKYPKHQDKVCYGEKLTKEDIKKEFSLRYFIQYYQKSNPKTYIKHASFLNKLYGLGSLASDLAAGKTEQEIRNSWEPALSAYKELRKKYLLYPDFK